MYNCKLFIFEGYLFCLVFCFHFFPEETDEVCIRRDTLRKDDELHNCDTIDKVMLAWVQRQRLYVTFNAKK
jgi:hypothetical protein